MRETRADTVLAVAIAVLLHGALLLLLVIGSWFRPPSSAAAGEPISADVVDLNALSARTRAALRVDPEPLPEPPVPPEPVEESVPEEPLPAALPEEVAEPQPKPQEQLPDPDKVDRQEVKPDATSAEVAAREQEAKRRQAQVDLTERERQQQAEQRAKNEMQRQREQQLEDIRRQRAQAQREAELAQAKLQQLADARARQASTAASNASPPPGQGGQSPDLLAAYQQALQQAILANWNRPDSVPLGQRCKIVIRQIAGGQVIDAQVDPSCPYDEPGRRSVERAVLLAQPLPYRGFESVFSRTVILNFRAEDP
ncbi:MAG: protein TolA [Lysobacter sp.]|nr:protein TolA [Lysobacter sp.]